MRYAFILAILAAVLPAGCNHPDAGGAPGKPNAQNPAAAYLPRSDVAKVVVTSEPTVSDSDKDGLPDSLSIDCYLFPPGEPPVPVVGKGAFRFELFDADQPTEQRVPFHQLNVNAEQGRRFVRKSRYGLLVYSLRLQLPKIPPGIRQVYVRVRFFPEDGRPEAEPGGASALVTSTAQPPRMTLPIPATQPAVGPGGRPETRIITIKPRTDGN